MRTDPLERFLKRITILPNGCHQWSSTRTDGYGTFTANDRCYVPQVWLYERLVGPIPKGWTLDHVCRNRGCVNVFSIYHIEAVPHKENIARAINHRSKENAAKTHCPYGHPYSKENTRTIINRKGVVSRACRICGRARR